MAVVTPPKDPGELHPVRPLEVVRVCTATETCGLRFPAPVGYENERGCPLCDAPTEAVGGVALHKPSEPTPVVRDIVGILDCVRSAFNVGAMIRTADGVGLSHLYVCGISAPPTHRKVAKTALSSQESVDLSHHLNVIDVVDLVLDSGYELWAMEATPTSESLFSSDLAPDDGRRIAVVVGNEVAGVDEAVLARAHRHVELPMYGIKDSLNVSVAFGAALYWLRSRGG